MKKHHHLLITLAYVGIFGLILFISLKHSKDDVNKEQERRNKMTKIITDENGK